MVIFPSEIIENTTESLFVKYSTHSRIIYLTVIISAVLVFILLPFIYVEISTQARGVIRSPYDNNQLQAAVYGEITEICITENTKVQKGDTLIILNSEAIQEQINRKKEKIQENISFVEDIHLLLAGREKNVITPKYNTERRLFNSTIRELQTTVEFLLNEYRVAKKLYDRSVSSKLEYLQHKNNYDAALRQKESVKEQFLNRWEAERTNYEIEIRELKSAIKQLYEEQEKYIIKAPASGSIIQFSGVKQGNFIAPSQTIAHISDDCDLLAECYVSPTDIGFITQGQKVAFQLDAFNYNQWGLAYGSVQEISNDIIIVNEQPVFRVRCALENHYLKLKSGYKGYLKKGMTLTGRFYLTERSLWQLLFDRVDDWINPKL
jgi:HlyD family secretion protein